jgi:hypothetical protein
VVLVPEADGNELAAAGVGLAGLLAGAVDFPVVWPELHPANAATANTAVEMNSRLRGHRPRPGLP